MKLYTYFRSSAAFRVRIALNLKNIKPDMVFVSLLKGEHQSEEYEAVNPQKMVPSLVLESGEALTQSMAIMEYLEDFYPYPPILPSNPVEKARARAIANAVICDIHPLNNLRVLKYITSELGVSEEAKSKWYKYWVSEGFKGIEKMLSRRDGKFCVGDNPTVADICLIPQVFNAMRFECDLKPFPAIINIYDECMKLEAFINAAPHKQPDAEQ